MKNPSSKKACLLRITAADRENLEQLLFSRYPQREWGTFFRFGYRITPWGLHITFVDALAPRQGELNRNSPIVTFNASYILRAQLALEDSELGIGIVHSHPEGCGTSASSLDDDMDGYFSREFPMYGGGRPYVTLRIAKDRGGHVTFSGEAWLNGEQMPVNELCTVGRVLRREAGEFVLKKAILDDTESTARVFELLGEAKVSRLKGSSVAIVGCGGTGSPAAHVLARAGVKRFFLVDPQFFSRSNHERFHASTWRDLLWRQLKVDLVRELILEINPNAEVITSSGNVLDDAVLDELLRCDLVLCCTDSQHSRAALSDYATHYLMPCIDSAVLMRANGSVLNEQVGEFARYSADEPCAWCLGRITQKKLSYELMSEEERKERKQAAREAVARGVDGEQYWGDEPPPELTVGYMTTTAGSMQAGYAQGWITGAFEMPHQRFQFDLGMPLLGTVPVSKERKPKCPCGMTKGWADQAKAYRSVTRPWHWPSVKDEQSE